MKGRGLLIRNVSEADNGDYTCRAEVEAEGRYDERKISLVVHSTYNQPIHAVLIPHTPSPLVVARDAREWLFTFSLPPIPVQSIPIPSHSHSRTLHRCSINYFWAREDSSLNMPLKLTISCVHFYGT